MLKLLPEGKLIDLGKFTTPHLDKFLFELSKIESQGRRIRQISSHFIGLPYKENTLIGSMQTKEVLVINLKQVDCFTFLDYVEAMSISASYAEFENNLIKVRYKGSIVIFKNRNHFFTDWVKFNADLVVDVTGQIGGKNTITIEKILNLKEDGTYFLDGIQPINRKIKYIPSGTVDDLIINKLNTGDYIGIYSERHGLDVSHVGIIIKNRGNIYLRHASSIKKKVLDEDFREYIMTKPGFIVLRHKD